MTTRTAAERRPPRAGTGWRHPGLLAVALSVVGCSSGTPADRSAHAVPFDTAITHADPDAGAVVFRRCAACHSISDGGPDRNGPNLYAVLGKPVAHTSDRYGYTAALQAKAGTWDIARMNAWLTNPQAFAPGTSMGFAGLPDSVDRANVIAYLNEQGSHLPLPKPATAR